MSWFGNILDILFVKKNDMANNVSKNLAPPSVTPLNWDAPDMPKIDPNTLPPSPTAQSLPPTPKTPQNAVLPPNTLLWDTPRHAYHSTRVVCDEMGLMTLEKNLICACIYQESRFNATVEGRINKNGSHDWGLVQINDGTLRGKPLWIGAGAAFSSVQEVLDSPEKCVRLMIRMYQAGHLNWWMSYDEGSYKQWLVASSPMWKLATA